MTEASPKKGKFYVDWNYFDFIYLLPPIPCMFTFAQPKLGLVPQFFRENNTIARAFMSRAAEGLR